MYKIKCNSYNAHMELRFSGDWFSNNVPIWTELLSRFRDKPSLKFLEIGSFEGKSACWLLQNILTDSSSQLTCVDIFDTTGDLAEEHRDILQHFPGLKDHLPEHLNIEENFDHNIRCLQAERKVRKLKGESNIVLRSLPLATYDCIYIDGSHRAPNVLKDIVLCWDLLKDDGIMILDDYLWNCFPHQPLKNPKPAIDACLTVFEGQYTILHHSYQIILQKIATSSLPP